jgi:hypothetical protein
MPTRKFGRNLFEMPGPGIVMPGLVPGIHGFTTWPRKDVDGRNKSGHDEWSPPDDFEP